MKNFRKIFSIIMALAIIAGSICNAFAEVGDTSGMVNDVSVASSYEAQPEDDLLKMSGLKEDGIIAKLDSANNVFAVGDVLNIVKGDFFGGFFAGKTLAFEYVTFDEALVAAGQKIDVTDTQVNSSAFMAASQINLESFYTYGNLFAAAMNISLGKSVNVKSVYAAGKDISFNGYTDTLRVAAQKVVIGGTVFGDAKIYADEVQILDSAVIYGNLDVTAKEEPAIPSSAKISNLNFTQMKESDTQSVQEIVNIKKANTVAVKIRTAISLCISFALAALLLCWLKPIFVENSITMLKTNTVKVFVTGLAVFVAVPFASFIVFTTIIGIPVALVVFALFISIVLFATVFAGTALGRMLLPKLDKMISAVIGTVVLVLLAQIPYLGPIISVASAFYALGVIFQLLWQTRQRKEKKQKVEEA